MNIPDSEFIEHCALEELHNAADESDIQSIGLASLTVGSAFVSVAPQLPSSAIVINRVVGLGLGTEVSSEEVHTLVSAYRNSKFGRYFVQIHPHHKPVRLTDWLINEGLRLGRGWQKFSRGRNPVATSNSDLSIREIGHVHGREFGTIVCDAFDLGDKAIPWISKLLARSDWHVFMSFDGNYPSGVGALYAKNGYGWTDFGATAPAFRRCGSQGVLMAARLERVLDLGCKKVFTCTGVNFPVARYLRLFDLLHSRSNSRLH